jgi:N-methylhydantoinase A/oxoprolinase/acetone carboxylase beta subunit
MDRETLMYRLGIDVGGTNTDAVVMRGRQVICAIKTPTTADVTTGVLRALQQILRDAGIAHASLGAVMIGTTHFVNALIERRELAPVGIIRLALPATLDIPPLSGWPEDMLGAIRVCSRLARGGFEFDGRELASVHPDEIRGFATEFAAMGIKNVAISGVFSAIDESQELAAAALVREVIPQARITLSSQIGRMGLLERENASILNAALGDLGVSTIDAFALALREAGVGAPFFLTQNDGTLMSAERAAQFPILTVSSGPTNSMRGAAFLSDCQEAIVVDIGGTTTDVGILVNGFPRQAGVAVDVAGVRTNFRMPDVLSIGLGGGTIISDDLTRIGPQSVGYRLTSEALVFGGKTLTASDIAVAAGVASMGDAKAVDHLDRNQVTACMALMQKMVAATVERMRTSADVVPVIVVGGGSVLVRDGLGDLPIVVPPHFGAANAVGAAMAQVSAEVDRVLKFSEVSREEAIARVQLEAEDQATSAGADPETLTVVDVEVVPLSYLAGNQTRIKVRVVGDLKLLPRRNSNHENH